MKRILKFIAVLFLALNVFAVNNDFLNVKAEEAPSVMLLIPGTLGDKSFFDSAYNGLKMIEENYGAKVGYIEMGLDQTKFAPTFEDVIDEGWDIIITGGQQVSATLTEIAESYPDQNFVLYDESVDYDSGDYSNVYSITYRQNEGAYVAGVLAALVTNSENMDKSNEDNVIGFVGGFDIPLINDHLVGLIEGALSVNPEIKVGIGYANSFTDASKGKEVGLNLYNSGADIIYQAAGGAGLGVFDAAKESDYYAIGTDSDQASLFANDEDKANAILTSMMKRVDVSLNLVIGRYISEGTLPFGQAESFGMAEDCIELVDNEWYQNNVSEDIKETI